MVNDVKENGLHELRRHALTIGMVSEHHNLGTKKRDIRW